MQELPSILNSRNYFIHVVPLGTEGTTEDADVHT